MFACVCQVYMSKCLLLERRSTFKLSHSAAASLGRRTPSARSGGGCLQRTQLFWCRRVGVRGRSEAAAAAAAATGGTAAVGSVNGVPASGVPRASALHGNYKINISARAPPHMRMRMPRPAARAGGRRLFPARVLTSIIHAIRHHAIIHASRMHARAGIESQPPTSI